MKAYLAPFQRLVFFNPPPPVFLNPFSLLFQLSKFRRNERVAFSPKVMLNPDSCFVDSYGVVSW